MTKKKTPPHSEVNCKSCGAVIDCTHDPENWCLQCDDCITNAVPLPKGYEHLSGTSHDTAPKGKGKKK